MNLKKLAQQLGVSSSTVSRVLSGKSGRRSPARARILALAREAGFVPDAQARALRTGRRTGLLLVADEAPTHMAAMRNHLFCQFGRKAFDSVRLLVRAKEESLDDVLTHGLAEGCVAAVVTSLAPGGEAVAAMARRKGIPLAAVDRALKGADEVLIDRRQGMVQVARLLRASGCRCITVFTDASREKPDARLGGLFSVFGKDAAPPKDEMRSSRQDASVQLQLVPITGGCFSDGYAMTRTLLQKGAPVALFAYNDEMAIGAIKALHDAGVRVPQDVRVVGFDDIPGAEFCVPSLTTVGQPTTDVVKEALAICRWRLENLGAPPKRVVFPTRLVIRESAPADSHALRQAVFAET